MIMAGAVTGLIEGMQLTEFLTRPTNKPRTPETNCFGFPTLTLIQSCAAVNRRSGATRAR